MCFEDRIFETLTEPASSPQRLDLEKAQGT